MTARTRLVVVVVAALALAAVPAGSQAAPGTLDPGFGVGGLVETDLGGDDAVAAALTDPTGRVLLVGTSERNSQTEREPFVVRYTSSGALDPSFGGGDGIAPVHFGDGGFDFATDAAIDAAGRIVVSGAAASDLGCTADCHAAVARLTESGQPDPTFAGDGVVTISTDFTRANGVAVDDAGRVVLGGNFAVYRFTESGTPDPGFGSGGTAPIVGGGFVGLGIDSAGRIVVAGEFVLERLLPTGQPDPDFGGDGSVLIEEVAPGSTEYLHAMALDGSDRILVGGAAFIPGGEANAQLFLQRYTPAGTLDPGFAGDGLYLNGSESQALGASVDAAGRALVVGYAEDLGGDVLIRLLPDGSFDPAFGAAGVAAVPFLGRAVTSDPSERVVVGGMGVEGDAAAARYADVSEPGPPDPPQPPAPIPPPSPTAPLLAEPPAPKAHPGCRPARKRVARLRGKLKRTSTKRQRAKARSQLRRARARAKRVC